MSLPYYWLSPMWFRLNWQMRLRLALHFRLTTSLLELALPYYSILITRCCTSESALRPSQYTSAVAHVLESGSHSSRNSGLCRSSRQNGKHRRAQPPPMLQHNPSLVLIGRRVAPYHHKLPIAYTRRYATWHTVAFPSSASMVRQAAGLSEALICNCATLTVGFLNHASLGTSFESTKRSKARRKPLQRVNSNKR